MTIDGDITFANKQLERLLKHKVEDMINTNIDMYIDSESRKHLRRMIKDLVNAEKQAALILEGPGSGSERTDSGAEEVGSNSSSGGGQRNGGASSSSDPNSSDPNIVSRSSDQSSPMIEVKIDRGESISDPSGSSRCEFKKKHKSCGTESSKGDSESDPPVKKAKAGNDRKGASAELIDDVNGEAVTANNAYAKLSSLHYHKTESKGKYEGVHKDSVDQSSSVDSSVSKTKEAHSSDSGYHREESNESSSSTMSNTSDDVATPTDGK
jgi:hypothetical protein